MSVDDEANEGETGFVEDEVVVFIPQEAGLELSEDGFEQGERRRVAFKSGAVELAYHLGPLLLLVGVSVTSKRDGLFFWITDGGRGT